MEPLSTSQKWFRIALLNLFIVAVLGVVMRYKIAFSLPIVDQKHVLHAHSHFAFAGWITQALMVLMVSYLSSVSGVNVFARYKWILAANLVTAYGMLGSFPVQGYGAVSITFSTLCILVSYAFAFMYWRDLNSLAKEGTANKWFKAALLFSVVSSAGTFALSYMNAAKISHPNWYLAAIYFYLHFQYNGWFFFACMGLLSYLLKSFTPVPFIRSELAFWIFAFACVPAYILSALWLPLPEWIHSIVSISALGQIAGLILLLRFVFKNVQSLNTLGPAKWILTLSLIALSIKLLLQFGSTFHVLSNLAFGFRPIVIGYLHLVLLGVITLFIVGYCMSVGIIPRTSNALRAITVFVTGIALNELLLMIQGVAAIANTGIPYINHMLLAAAIIMLIAISWLNLGVWRNKSLIIEADKP